MRQALNKDSCFGNQQTAAKNCEKDRMSSINDNLFWLLFTWATWRAWISASTQSWPCEVRLAPRFNRASRLDCAIPCLANISTEHPQIREASSYMDIWNDKNLSHDVWRSIILNVFPDETILFDISNDVKWAKIEVHCVGNLSSQYIFQRLTDDWSEGHHKHLLKNKTRSNQER